MALRGLTVALIAGIALVGGCSDTGVDTGTPLFTVDLRLDGAEPANDPESAGTQMCVSEDGIVYVIWMDNRTNPTQDRRDIWLQRSVGPTTEGGPSWNDADTWFTAPKKVNQGDPDHPSNVFNPSLYCNDIGAFVVWEDDRDGELDNHQIYFNRTTDLGESFLPDDVLLENDPDGNSMSLEPKITGNRSSLYAVWYDSKNGAYDILVSSSSNAGESWDSPVRVDSDAPAGSAYSARPEILTSSANDSDVWITWEDSRDGAADIYFSRSETGGTTFATDIRLDSGDDPGVTDSFEPQICSDGDSNVTVVWHDSKANDLNRDIYLNFSVNKGENWLTTAQRIDGTKETVPGESPIEDAPGFGNSLFPQCASDGLTSHVVWYDQVNEGEGYDIYYRAATSGLLDGEFARRLDLGPDEDFPEPAGFANSLAPIMAKDGNTVVVVWNDGRNDSSVNPSGYTDLFYSYLDETTEETFAMRDFRLDSMWDASSYKIDVDAAVLGKTLFAVWVDGRNGTGDVYFRSIEIGDEAIPPTQDLLNR